MVIFLSITSLTIATKERRGSSLPFAGSNKADLPFANLFTCAPSADVILEEVVRIYSRAAVKAGMGSATLGHKAFWTVSGYSKRSVCVT